jgi:very-short-patch-repair endonuclease
MQDIRIHTLKHLQDYRSTLRKNLTPAEATLWKFLKNKQLKGRKFTRQHSIENYIVDFYCSSEKLIIELDGQVHFNAMASQYDAERSERLNHLGYTVVRFENKLVFENIEGVLDYIASHFSE